MTFLFRLFIVPAAHAASAVAAARARERAVIYLKRAVTRILPRPICAVQGNLTETHVHFYEPHADAYKSPRMLLPLPLSLSLSCRRGACPRRTESERHVTRYTRRGNTDLAREKLYVSANIETIRRAGQTSSVCQRSLYVRYYFKVIVSG